MTTVDHHQENHSSSRAFDSHVAKIILDEGSGVESGFHTDSTCTEEGSETPGSMDMSEGEKIFMIKRNERRKIIVAEAKARRNARAIVRKARRKDLMEFYSVLEKNNIKNKK
jgi:hypothetical protein